MIRTDFVSVDALMRAVKKTGRRARRNRLAKVIGWGAVPWLFVSLLALALLILADAAGLVP